MSKAENEDGNWLEWKNLVLSELERSSSAIESLDTKLGTIQVDLSGKVDHDDLDEVKKEVESAHRKINYFTGIFATIGAGIGFIFGKS